MSVFIKFAEVEGEVEAMADSFDFTTGDTTAEVKPHLQTWQMPQPVIISSYQTGGGTYDGTTDEVSLDFAAISPSHDDSTVDPVVMTTEEFDGML